MIPVLVPQSDANDIDFCGVKRAGSHELLQVVRSGRSDTLVDVDTSKAHIVWFDASSDGRYVAALVSGSPIRVYCIAGKVGPVEVACQNHNPMGFYWTPDGTLQALFVKDLPGADLNEGSSDVVLAAWMPGSEVHLHHFGKVLPPATFSDSVLPTEKQKTLSWFLRSEPWYPDCKLVVLSKARKTFIRDRSVVSAFDWTTRRTSSVLDVSGCSPRFLRPAGPTTVSVTLVGGEKPAMARWRLVRTFTDASDEVQTETYATILFDAATLRIVAYINGFSGAIPIAPVPRRE